MTVGLWSQDAQKSLIKRSLAKAHGLVILRSRIQDPGSGGGAARPARLPSSEVAAARALRRLLANARGPPVRAANILHIVVEVKAVFPTRRRARWNSMAIDVCLYDYAFSRGNNKTVLFLPLGLLNSHQLVAGRLARALLSPHQTPVRP